MGRIFFNAKKLIIYLKILLFLVQMSY